MAGFTLQRVAVINMNPFTRRLFYAVLCPIMMVAALYGVSYMDVAVPAPASADPVVATFDDPALIARGKYVARLGDCAGCHTATAPGSPPFAGGQAMNSPFGMIYVSNITPDAQTGIGAYSFEDFERAVRQGVAPGGKRLYPAMPYPSFTRISDADVRALYAYFMHGVHPVRHRPPPTNLPFPFSQRWGLWFWDLAFVDHGRFEPDEGQDPQWVRGAYLTQSLGHCGACHTPRGVAFQVRGYDESSDHYLTGGINDDWFAPNLTGDPGSGLGRLSEQNIVSFLKTGHGTPLHIVAFGSMVPVIENSTQHFSDSDLQAVAHYLKSLPARKASGAYQAPSGPTHPGRADPDQEQADPANPAPVDPTAQALDEGRIHHPGAGLYMSFCVKCHVADGKGKDQKFPALAGNPAVLAPDATSLVRLVLQGGDSPQTATGPKSREMPAFAQKLTDTEIARVLSFVRSAWGNQARPVTRREVSTLRHTLKGSVRTQADDAGRG